MDFDPSAAFAPLHYRLQPYGGIAREDLRRLNDLPYTQMEFAVGRRIAPRGRQLDRIYLIISGWVGQSRYLMSGTRQIVHVLLPGDIVPANVFALRKLDHELEALTHVVIRLFDPEDFVNLLQTAPELNMALWWAAEQQYSILRESIVRLGRRSSIERVAHLFLELHRRLLIIRQAKEESFMLPMTQEAFRDVLGLSLVHMNRMLRQLEKQKLIERKDTTIQFRNRQELSRLCDFDPAHLHLNGEGAWGGGK